MFGTMNQCYKTLSNIPLSRLIPYADEIAGISIVDFDVINN
jgi:hypothetical protein